MTKPLVLVVDDLEEVRKVLRRHLTLLGYEVIDAGDGQEALAVLAFPPLPDIVVTDINMPRMDGVELLRQIKASDDTRDIPVIVISSQDDRHTVAECISAGAEDHIAKPFQQEVLNARLGASVERKRLRDYERAQQRRVAALTAAAEAVEADRYRPGSLDEVAAADDQLGRLARVFDRMVGGMRAREERLHRRVRQLRAEMADTDKSAAVVAQVSEQSPFASGELLAARYQVEAQLGAGGMGMVYRALDLELGESVAIKVVRSDLVAKDPTILDRLKSEIRLARRISHRNVVRMHDLGEWNGTAFVTMEYVQGVTLEELIDRRGRLSVDATLAVGAQLAEALAVAHDAHIIHRDIKPANLLVDGEGTLKVMDFGIARSRHAEDKLTQGGFIVGTPFYMPPEVLTGKTADGRSDLFAMGVVLYECLAGRPPFAADSPIQMLAQMSEAQYRRLGDFVPGVPPALERLIDDLLCFQADARPANARIAAERIADAGHAPDGVVTTVSAVEVPLDLVDEVRAIGTSGQG